MDADPGALGRVRSSILLVDDQPANLLALQVILEGLGQELVTAASGEEALRLLLARDFAVILLDVQMGGLDGFETARFVRSRRRSRHTPIVFITAHESPVFPVAQAYALGAVDFLVKPLQPEILRAKVAVFVELFQKTEEVKRQAQRLRHFEQREFERKLDEEARRQSEQRFQLLADTAPALLWLSDADGRRSFVNRPWLEFTGRTLDQELGTGWLEGCHPDDRQRALDIHENGFQAREPFSLEYRLRRADGSYGWVLDRGVPRPTPTGDFAGFVGTAVDITDRKQLEEQFLQAQKMEAIGRLAGGIAHDFNNLMTVVNGYSDLLGQKLAGSPLVSELVEPIRAAGERASALTRQLLAFGRKQMLTPQALDLNVVVRGLAPMARRLIREDIELRLDLAAAPLPVKADPTQLEQVLLNLIVNARDAMPHGGSLSIATAADEWDEAFATPGESRQRSVCLTVTDTGCGMSDAAKSHLFEPFFTTKGQGKGTGLGLPTVYGIVTQSGGWIAIDSTLGQGTVVRIHLPFSPEAIQPLPAAPPADGGERGCETVLLVEDEDVVRRLAGHILRRAGYAVLEANQGSAALAVSEQHHGPLHLLVTDLVMPGMNGKELAHRLRLQRPDLPVLYLSGYAAETEFRPGELEAHSSFMQKPFVPALLLSRVRQLLDQAGEGDAAPPRPPGRPDCAHAAGVP